MCDFRIIKKIKLTETNEEIDIEENDDFAVKYSIRSLPTTLIFMDDIELFRFVGTRSKEELKEIIDKYVK